MNAVLIWLKVSSFFEWKIGESNGWIFINNDLEIYFFFTFFDCFVWEWGEWKTIEVDHGYWIGKTVSCMGSIGYFISFPEIRIVYDLKENLREMILRLKQKVIRQYWSHQKKTTVLKSRTAVKSIFITNIHEH